MPIHELRLWGKYFRKYCPTGFNPFVREDFMIARLLHTQYSKVEFSKLIPVYGDGDEANDEEVYDRLKTKVDSIGKLKKGPLKTISFNRE